MTLLAETGSVVPLQNPNARPEFTDFHKLLQARAPTPAIIEVTPKLAREMIKLNKENQRYMRVMKVAQFMMDMRGSNWLVTGQGISFDWDGHLCDGQHRLRACINAKRPFRTLAMFGCDPKVFTKVDIGRSRSPGDILHIAGITNATTTAAAIRWLKSYKSNTITPGQTSANAPMTAEAILNYCMEHGDLRKRISEKITLIKGAKLASPSMGLAFYTLFYRKNKAAAHEYIDKVYGGKEISDDDDPAGVVRSALLANRRKFHRLTQPQCAYILARGWNAFRTNDYIRAEGLRWRRGEPFPRLR